MAKTKFLLEQLVESINPGSFITTDNNNIPTYLTPGSEGQIINVVNGVPTYVDKGIYLSGQTFDTNTFILTSNLSDGNVVNLDLSTLSSDRVITGGTYNSVEGTITYNTSSGTAFTVTGFVTGFTDNFITGGTYNNGDLTLSNVNNDDIIISGFSINSNEFTTGGTYNKVDGTLTFVSNSGSTFDVAGFDLEGYNESGSKNGGDLLITIGDFNDSGNSNKIIINDSTNNIDLKSSIIRLGNNITGTSFNTTYVENFNISSQPNLVTSNKVLTRNNVGDIEETIIEKETFDSNLDSNLIIPNEWEENTENITIEDLQGKTMTELIETLFFPTINAFVSTNKGILISGINTQNLEVGTVLTLNINIIFNKGIISNGDNSIAGDLVGDINTILVKNTNTNLNLVTDGSPSSNSVSYVINNYIIGSGNNQLTVNGNHTSGNTTYSDNKGNVGTNLAPLQVAGTATTNSNIISGRYNKWHYLGNQNTSPVTSSNVRVLTTNEFLSTNNTGNYTFLVPSGTQEVSIYIPAGKTLTVIDTGNLNNDLSSSFTKSNITVADAGGTNVNYEKATIFLGLGGFTQDTNFAVSVS